MNQQIQNKIHTLANDLRVIADALDSMGKDTATKPESLDRLARLGVQTVAYALKDMVYEMKIGGRS